MATVIYPNDGVKKIESVFLGGTIDNGAESSMWQQQIISSLKDVDVKLYNPRRLDWDSSWENTENNPQFNQQVSWELSCLEKSDLIVMYFAPNSISPISLLEFGLFYNKMIVCCPEGFWRKGNVDVVCRRYNIPKVNTLSELVDEVLYRLKD